MGVQGLLSFCTKYRRDDVVQTVDLVEVARQQGGIEILVDFFSFEHFVDSKMWAMVSQQSNNEYLKILGGEYGTLHNYSKKLIEDLKSVDISLVFYVDGSKGSSTEDTRQKIDTWISRHHKDVEKIDNIIKVCSGRKPISELEEYCRPPLQGIQFLKTVRDCGCEMVSLATGEADYVIAKALRDREKAYAVFSNDSDFCVFKDCCLITNELFDLQNDLHLDKPVELQSSEKPFRIMTGVVRTEKVMNAFGFRDHSLLVELSIVAGNDYTGPHMRSGLKDKLDLRGGRGLGSVAGWVKHYKRVENSPTLEQEMYCNKDFCSAVYYTRKFYGLNLPPQKLPKSGYLAQLIEKGITEGKFPNHIMGIHNNFYWHRTLVEDNTYGHPCGGIAMVPLRAHIYRIVLPRHESMVNEYGRSPWEPLRIAGVLTVEDDNIPSIHRIREEKIFWNLKHFHYIMSHQEQGSRATDSSWFDRYGRKTGFVVYVLRYFLLLNWGRNLYVTENEFLALLALAMGRPKEHHYQTVRLRPTPRCVTLGSWFQNVYSHAYNLLGKVLYLTHEFPEPQEMFSGSAWTAYYTCSSDETFYAGVTQVPMEVLRRTQDEMNRIIKEKRHMIRYIVEGVFYYDDRY